MEAPVRHYLATSALLSLNLALVGLLVKSYAKQHNNNSNNNNNDDDDDNNKCLTALYWG